MSSNQITAKQAVAANLNATVTVGTLPGTGVEDAAETAGGTLLMAGTVRRDTAASSAGTTGDNATLNTDANGKLWVSGPALGTAGTASADVITVQGIAAGLPLQIGTNQLNISQTPTVTNGAYSINDAVGGLLTFANAARVNAGSGYVQAVTILCKAPALLPALELVLFNQTFTAMTDNGTWSPSDGDMANCIGSISLTSWSDSTTNSIAIRFGLGFPFSLTGTSLFGQLVLRSALTLTSTSDLIVGIQVIRD